MVSSAIVFFLAAFAFIVMLVSFFLSRFKVKNTIDEEINEMGVLKGVGYTSSMIFFETNLWICRKKRSSFCSDICADDAACVYERPFFNVNVRSESFLTTLSEELPDIRVLLIITAVILTAVNIVIGIILCRPVKKINPYSLIKD